VPMIAGYRGLIDGDTPSSMLTRTGFDGKARTLPHCFHLCHSDRIKATGLPARVFGRGEPRSAVVESSRLAQADSACAPSEVQRRRPHIQRRRRPVLASRGSPLLAVRTYLSSLLVELDPLTVALLAGVSAAKIARTDVLCFSADPSSHLQPRTLSGAQHSNDRSIFVARLTVDCRHLQV
jgi:hypothetical protein